SRPGKEHISIPLFQTAQELRRGILQHGSSQVQIHRPHNISAARNNSRLSRHFHFPCRCLQSDLEVFPGGKWVVPLVIIDEYKAVILIESRSHSRSSRIVFALWHPLREIGSHGGQTGTEIIKKQVKGLQSPKRWIHLPKLTERGLVVVRFHRKIVEVTGGLGFLQSGEFAFRICSSVKHVI